MMADEISRMSEEDKFLGVRTTVDTTKQEELNVEVVDDRPEGDQRAPAIETPEDGGTATDEELSQLGNRAQKRIKKLKWEYHEERRAKEASDKLATEAISYTQGLQTENQRLVQLVQDSQTALTDQAKHRASATLAIAEEAFKQAHDSGDSEQIAKTQKDLTNAQLAQAYAPSVSQKIIDNWKRNVLAQDQAAASEASQQYVPEALPEPDSRAVSWQESNEWFGQDREMTSFAYGVHERLVGEEGIDPDSDEYYKLIDNRMKEVFPTQFGSDSTQYSNNTVVVDAASRRKANPVVAPASRNNGAPSHRVTLTQTQVKLAERLGITPQQYAAQLIKEMS
tara:strand:+ start:57 stop:1070 length:1014 start_codon:yes stop_codon:yes gene_type:complete